PTKAESHPSPASINQLRMGLTSNYLGGWGPDPAPSMHPQEIFFRVGKKLRVLAAQEVCRDF
ncbi:hypothetical protein, partial [Corynebacterium diphtheriae]|uniref:hypothetical protein n=1 Tax=Corynebacterium diphtheriae TaxID=1717 RepID=UPI001A7E999D